jgi:hypothetical protein
MNITSVFRLKITTAIKRVTIPTNKLKSLNPAQCPWVHLWQCTGSILWVLCISTQKHSLSSSSSDASFLRTPLHNCLDFRDSSWLPLNNLPRLADLRCAFTSGSNWAFTGVSVKKALTLDFLLQVSLRTPPLGKVWCLLDLSDAHFLQKVRVLHVSRMLKSDC